MTITTERTRPAQRAAPPLDPQDIADASNPLMPVRGILVAVALSIGAWICLGLSIELAASLVASLSQSPL